MAYMQSGLQRRSLHNMVSVIRSPATQINAYDRSLVQQIVSHMNNMLSAGSGKHSFSIAQVIASCGEELRGMLKLHGGENMCSDFTNFLARDVGVEFESTKDGLRVFVDTQQAIRSFHDRTGDRPQSDPGSGVYDHRIAQQQLPTVSSHSSEIDARDAEIARLRQQQADLLREQQHLMLQHPPMHMAAYNPIGLPGAMIGGAKKSPNLAVVVVGAVLGTVILCAGVLFFMLKSANVT